MPLFVSIVTRIKLCLSSARYSGLQCAHKRSQILRQEVWLKLARFSCASFTDTDNFPTKYVPLSYVSFYFINFFAPWTCTFFFFLSLFLLSLTIRHTACLGGARCFLLHTLVDLPKTAPKPVYAIMFDCRTCEARERLTGKVNE